MWLKMNKSRHDQLNDESLGAFDIKMHRNTWRLLYTEYNELKSLMSVQLDMHEQIKKLEADLAGAKHQKKLSDALEKLLLDVIKSHMDKLHELGQAMPPNAISMYCSRLHTETIKSLSSVAKKLEGI
jgi:hypothetical protein